MINDQIFLKPILKDLKTNSFPGTSIRSGEIKLGQSIHALQSQPNDFNSLVNDLKEKKAQLNLRFALIGISEDVGPRANLGKPGAGNGWSSFMNILINMQDNKYFTGKDIIVIGEVDVSDIQSKSLSPECQNSIRCLRDLVSQIDFRVKTVIDAVIEAGLEPIVVGGGHNNSYPIINSLSGFYKTKIDVINLDPHSDCRELEGRHSGNPFSYAYSDNLISKYTLIGMDPHYNNEFCLAILDKNDASYKKTTTFDLLTPDENILVRDVLSSQNSEIPTMLTIDCDAVTEIPSSARTNIGLLPSTAFNVITESVKHKNVVGLFLAEAAPSLSDMLETKNAGKFQSYCVTKYIKDRRAKIDKNS